MREPAKSWKTPKKGSIQIEGVCLASGRAVRKSFGERSSTSEIRLRASETYASKVPKVTLGFWIVKILAMRQCGHLSRSPQASQCDLLSRQPGCVGCATWRRPQSQPGTAAASQRAKNDIFQKLYCPPQLTRKDGGNSCKPSGALITGTPPAKRRRR